jgi:NADH-quinone oxidoreductase subunit C
VTDQTQTAPAEETAPELPLPVQRLKDTFGEAILDHEEHRGQLMVQVERERIVEILGFLRDAPELQLDHLSDLTAADYLSLNEQRNLENAPRFAVVYQLYSLANATSLRVKVMLTEEDSMVPSVIPVYPGANWPEREVYDMFGIRFSGHPNLTRILTPDDWQGHPLRKDYPLIEEDVEFTVNTSYPPEKLGPRRG